MSQPDYVPLVHSDRVRASKRLSLPGHWVQDRPAELVSLRPPEGVGFGATGPDLGFGLKLAQRVAQNAELAPGERLGDAVAGCFASGTKRASVLHRAPVVYDMEWAFALWGFLPGAPEGLVGYRKPLFAGAGHDYARQRAIADLVPERLAKLSPADVAAGLHDWSKWLGAAKAP